MSAAGARCGTAVAAGELVDRRQFRGERLGKFDGLAAACPDAVRIDGRAPILLQRLVPDSRRLGQYAAPAIGRLEQIGIAEADTVGCAKLDEVSVPLFAEEGQHQEILEDLRFRLAVMRDAVIDERRFAAVELAVPDPRRLE